MRRAGKVQERGRWRGCAISSHRERAPLIKVHAGIVLVDREDVQPAEHGVERRPRRAEVTLERLEEEAEGVPERCARGEEGAGTHSCASGGRSPNGHCQWKLQHLLRSEID